MQAKTIFEQHIFLHSQGWLQGEYAAIRVNIVGEDIAYELWRSCNDGTFEFLRHYEDAGRAFMQYCLTEFLHRQHVLPPNYRGSAARVERFEKQEMILTPAQRMAIDVLLGDPIANDILTDVIARGQ